MKAARALPILMYHHVSPSPGLVTVNPVRFRAHVEGLAKAGWRTAGLEEVGAFLRGEPLPARTCVLTFDDGYLDNFVYAHPVLADFGMKAVLFVVTGWLGDGSVRGGTPETPNHNECKRRIAAGEPDNVMLRWSEVEAMQAAGTFEFHSHTHSHTRWDREIPDQAERDERLARDLSDSRSSLKARLGTVSSHLCWPQGYFDAAYQRVAGAAGFDHLYTVERGTVFPKTPAQRLPRIVAKDRDAGWLMSRLRIYSNPLLARCYSLLHAD